jgi:hypothetical protein
MAPVRHQSANYYKVSKSIYKKQETHPRLQNSTHVFPSTNKENELVRQGWGVPHATSNVSRTGVWPAPDLTLRQ